jgi:hypothetical protein
MNNIDNMLNNKVSKLNNYTTRNMSESNFSTKGTGIDTNFISRIGW